jgi:DNA-binding FadR family transcriptional regulator
MTLPERIADQIRRGILEGALRPGKRLESCRAMARDADVAVDVIREAIAQLRGEGFVEVKHGIGVFVAARRRKARALRAARRTASRREMFEVRAALEPLAAEAATRRAGRAAQLELRLLLGERERSRYSGIAQSFAEADIAFHRAVLRMCGNRLAAAGGELAAPGVIRHVVANAEALASDADLHALHGRLTDAIEARRPSLARRCARAIVARESAGARRPP